MKAGRLRKRVTLQQVTETRDSSGGVVQSWADVADLWAGVEPIRGREYWNAKALQADVMTRIIIRYRAGVVPKMRIVYGTRAFDIQEIIDPDERHRELALMVREVL